MRIRTDVLTPLAAALVLCFIAFLPASQSQTNANALHKEIAIYTYKPVPLSYIEYRAMDVASRSNTRTALNVKQVSKVPLRKKALKTAYRYIGVKYCRGGSSPSCFDCSGFIQYIYKKNGMDMPRTTTGQLHQARVIKKKYAKAGDLVFFYNGKGHIYHVGVYVGNGKVLHSPKPGKRVKVEKIWTKRIIFGRIS